MKRGITVLIFGLFIAGSICAQSTEIITNSSVAKMVKARLSDKLIIDVIQSSAVKFDLSEDAINDLTVQHVSAQVIDAMKLTAEVKKSSKNKNNEPDMAVTYASSSSIDRQNTKRNIPRKTAAETQEQDLAEEAVGYVTPMKELITYNEEEFKKLVTAMEGWDKRINGLISAAKTVNDKIFQTETEIYKNKDANAKSYSEEILSLKKKLNDYRENYKKAKAELLKGGEDIAGELEEISSDKIKSAGNVYGDVSQEIKSAYTEPSEGLKTEPLSYLTLRPGENTSFYISPVTEMLVWHVNEIKVIQEIIKTWNEKVKKIIASDEELSRQAEPLLNKLKEYQTDSKKYKTEISELKKKSSAIEKERKKLANQMKDDSKDLSDTIKDIRTEIQNTIKQRFTDIIENVNYSFQENLNI